MDEFVSTFTNRLDAKGRVSIPAPFRAVLAVDGFDGLYCCPTLDRSAVDAGGNRFREAIRSSLANFEPFSEDHELLSTTLIGESEILIETPFQSGNELRTVGDVVGVALPPERMLYLPA